MKNSNFVLLSIFLVSLVQRVLVITIPMNVDEGSWLHRGTNFIKYLFDGDLAATYLRHHPGVTNMWLIGISQFLSSLFYQLFPDWLDLNQSPLQHVCFDEPFAPPFCPISLYVMPRVIQALITSACMVGIYLLTKRLLGRPIALIAMSLLILSPFFLAYQRYITTDALQTDFSILAVLFLLLYLRGNSNRRLLFSSAIFMGLATASKIPALFILPAIVVWIVLIELGVWRTSFPRRGWICQFCDLIIWGVTASAVIFLILPALWAAPLETLGKLYEGLLKESERGALFFLGEFTDSPGPLFYPLVLAYRLSPLLQVGLLTCLGTLLIPRLRHRLDKMPELVAIALIPLSVIFILSNIDSKIDRYIVVILPELALLAGAGWFQIGNWVKAWGRIVRWKTKEGINTAIALAVAQLFLLVPHYPYYITYYNPLLGGSQAAKNLFMLGQGEGLDIAAKWLNQSPDTKEITVTSWYSLVFGSYFQGKTLELRKFSPDNLSHLNWTKANRIVLYFNQLQRQLPEAKMLAYFGQQQPLYKVRVDDIDYVMVYPGPLCLPEDLQSIQFPLSLSFDNQVRLLGYELNTSKLKSTDELIVTFYWEFLDSISPDLTLNIKLSNQYRNIFNSSQTSLVDGYLPFTQIVPSTIIRDVRKVTIAPEALPGQYSLEVAWFSQNTKQALQAQNVKRNSYENQTVIAEVEIVKSVKP